MNASLDTVPALTRQGSARVGAPVHDLTVREGILEIPGEVSLFHGGKLPGMRVAWRMVGPANAPIWGFPNRSFPRRVRMSGST